MKQKLLNFSALFALIFVLGTQMAWAQGSTTSAMNGRVVDANGEPLPGATVIAVHQPTGSKYGNVTDFDGYYRLANMQVGGPYTITVTFVGYQEFSKSGLMLALGQTLRVNATLEEGATELETVEIIADANDVFDGNRTGQQTIVDESTINQLPTVSRSIGDFARLNPLANIQEGSDGFTISLGGMNNRLNAIYIDGAINNDVFGLAGSGTNGGQTGAAPVSIDAIEQFQVSIAPFDVRQSGFAGGSINAVTRSGTNEVEGSAYYFLRNENLAGKTPTDDETRDREKLNEFSAQTYGLRIGGPIVKNKLFFFVSAELQRDETPQPFDFADYNGDATQADINNLVNFLQSNYGYDPGTYTNNAAFTNADRFLVKFDYNLSQNHKISLRHSYTNIENLEAVQSTSTGIRFLNGSEYFPSTTNSTALEVKSTFGNNKSNSLIIGYTSVEDDRDPFGMDFPRVFIADGRGGITFGSEPFSTANFLEQQILTITDNFELYKGKHTITIGTHNEFYSVGNLFIPQNFGSYEWARSAPINGSNLADFLAGENSSAFFRSYSQVDNLSGDDSKAIAAFNYSQLGLYVQDELQVNDNFKLTAGLRVDLPIFEETPLNADFNNTTIPMIESFGYDLEGAQTGQFIKTQLLVAPRIGFNYDIKGDKTTQVRGGIGIFNSRIPLVWPGGAYNNYGFNIGGTRAFGTQPFIADIQNQPPGAVDLTNPAPSGNIDLFSEDFKIPQVVKFNAALDQKLPGGIIGTAEFLYTKFLNYVRYQNLNIKPSTVSLTGSPDDRPVYDRRDLIDNTYGGIYLATNTNEGYAWNAAFTLTKPFTNGLNASVSYSYGDSYSVFDGTSSQNSSQWRNLHTVGGRNFQTTAQRSDFSQGSRIAANLSYRKEYGGFAASQLSLFYNGQSGRLYSYIYNDNGNLTSEDSREYSLIYVPANASEINLVDYVDGDGNTVTAAQQYANLEQFINDDPYLSERRGQYAERNTNRTPFESILDLKFQQDFFIEMANGKRNTLTFTLDIFNFSNMLNKDWGRRYFNGSFGNADIIDFVGFAADGTTPLYRYDQDPTEKIWEGGIIDSGFRSSRWQMQVGVRYTFQ